MKIKFWWLVFSFSLVQTTFLGTQRYYLYLRKESKKGEKIAIQNVEFKIQNERKKPERAIKEIKEIEEKEIKENKEFKELNDADLKTLSSLRSLKSLRSLRSFHPSSSPFLILGEKISHFVK